MRTEFDTLKVEAFEEVAYNPASQPQPKDESKEGEVVCKICNDTGLVEVDTFGSQQRCVNCFYGNAIIPQPKELIDDEAIEAISKEETENNSESGMSEIPTNCENVEKSENSLFPEYARQELLRRQEMWADKVYEYGFYDGFMLAQSQLTTLKKEKEELVEKVKAFRPELEFTEIPEFDLSRKHDHVYCVEWGMMKQQVIELGIFDKMISVISNQ